MRGLCLWEFLTSEIPCPPCPTAPARPTIPEKATNEAKKELLDEFADLLKSYESQFNAYRCWLDEYARAGSILTASMEHQFAAEIEQLLCHGDLTIDELYTQVSAIWRQIDSLRPSLSPSTCEFCQCHQSDIELQRAHAFLICLRDEYEPLRAQLFARHPFVSSMDAVAAVRNEETRLRSAGLLPSVSALAARSAPSWPVVPPLSSPSSAPVPSPSVRGGGGGLHCDYYGKDGHVEVFCYRKKKAQRSQTRPASQAPPVSQPSGGTSTGVSQRSSTDPVTQEMLMLLRRLAASLPSGTVNIFLMLFVRSFLRKNGVAERKHRHLLETARALMLASSVSPHFWAEAVSTATYLINIQHSSALHGGIPLERLCGKASDYSGLRLFGCVCYVLLAPCEHTKLTAQSLRYSAEHKGYRCWDPVGRRMWIFRDVVFDESRPFYPRPSSDASFASLVDPLSFLFILDTAMAHIPSRVPSPTVPASGVVPPSVVPPLESPSESSSLPPDYTTKPPVT
ncbi:hypothetical protein U9M48_039040 [Paspalum notatum var. saurae]|uniref:Retroviral polymerase SH3-like domain-containing protein n=1 Tax=Paspalum notatum var. saurae TaxID=547442 RepID=A0AAQ3UN34_PASNO